MQWTVAVVGRVQSPKFSLALLWCRQMSSPPVYLLASETGTQASSLTRARREKVMVDADFLRCSKNTFVSLGVNDGIESIFCWSSLLHHFHSFCRSFGSVPKSIQEGIATLRCLRVGTQIFEVVGGFILMRKNLAFGPYFHTCAKNSKIYYSAHNQNSEQSHSATNSKIAPCTTGSGLM